MFRAASIAVMYVIPLLIAIVESKYTKFPQNTHVQGYHPYAMGLAFVSKTKAPLLY